MSPVEQRPHWPYPRFWVLGTGSVAAKLSIVRRGLEAEFQSDVRFDTPNHKPLSIFVFPVGDGASGLHHLPICRHARHERRRASKLSGSAPSQMRVQTSQKAELGRLGRSHSLFLPLVGRSSDVFSQRQQPRCRRVELTKRNLEASQQLCKGVPLQPAKTQGDFDARAGVRRTTQGTSYFVHPPNQNQQPTSIVGTHHPAA